jgi:hypothetical protein
MQPATSSETVSNGALEEHVVTDWLGYGCGIYGPEAKVYAKALVSLGVDTISDLDNLDEKMMPEVIMKHPIRAKKILQAAAALRTTKVISTTLSQDVQSHNSSHEQQQQTVPPPPGPVPCEMAYNRSPQDAAGFS